MKRLMLSFIFSLLTAQSAYAEAQKSRADHTVKLVESFQAGEVDQAINSSIGKIKCGDGISHNIDNEQVLKDSKDVGRAPALIASKGKFQQFIESVEKGEFRDSFYKEGDIYSYSSETSESKIVLDIFNYQQTTHEHVFVRKSQAGDKSFEHEFGISEEKVRDEIVALLKNADEKFQVDEKAFAVRVKGKAYLIDLKLPLMANPIYKQDVSTGNIEYGFTSVSPRSESSTPVVSLSK